MFPAGDKGKVECSEAGVQKAWRGAKRGEMAKVSRSQVRRGSECQAQNLVLVLWTMRSRQMLLGGRMAR